MFLGIDIGTSGVKALLVDDTGIVRAQSQAPLTVSRPHPLWSEQDPRDWWTATEQAVLALPASLRSAVRAVGLSGQMHSATLLDEHDRPLRPAILWNDGRSDAQCRELEARVPQARTITGNLAMPGFTAPNILWVERNEPLIFKRLRHVVLPKDYVRLRMTGGLATDVSDASGTLWLDVARREWSHEMLAATGLKQSHMPQLFEGTQLTGQLRADVAVSWSMDPVPVAAGASDNAAGAIGAGVINAGQGLLSLGTSGVIFAADDRFRPNPARAMHAFCHALPQRWHEMAVMLSAAASLDWVAKLAGYPDATSAVADAERDSTPDGREVFLPYLSGERTPHNDPHAQGVFFGLSHDTTRASLVRAVLEGVAFAFADGLDALREAGVRLERLCVIGGGARSTYWGSILATALDLPLDYRSAAEVGPAYGAARLARLALDNEVPIVVCSPPAIVQTIEPDATIADALQSKRLVFKDLYVRLRDLLGRESRR